MNAAYMPDRIAAWLVKDENSSIVIGQFCERGTFVPPPDSPPAREYVGVELLTTAEERATKAKDALAAESLLHDLTRMACDKLRAELEECKQRKGKAVAYRTVTEAENTRLKAEMRGMVRVDVLLRWMRKTVSFSERNGKNALDYVNNKAQRMTGLQRALTAAEERARVAEEKLSGCIKWSDVDKDEWKRRYTEEVKTTVRLTAEVKEWYDKWVQATNDLACESEDLDTLRRSSVRVDVLLRYMDFIATKNWKQKDMAWFKLWTAIVRHQPLRRSRASRKENNPHA